MLTQAGFALFHRLLPTEIPVLPLALDAVFQWHLHILYVRAEYSAEYKI